LDVWTPGSATRAGPGVSILVLLVLAIAGCDTPPQLQPPAELELEDRTVLLERGAELHDIRLHSPSTGDPVQPDSVDARPGDALRFMAADAMTHAIAFDESMLSSEQREFLESTRQLRSPPLLATGSTWVVSLDGAPIGRYPFRSLTHDARGVVIVAATE